MEQRGRGLLALGRALAQGGVIAKIGGAVAALTALGILALAFRVAGGDDPDALSSIPFVAANGLAWGAGILVAVGGSMRAFHRDRDEGVRDLLRARGVLDTRYLWARVAGLATTLAVLVGGGTLLVGGVAVLLAHGRPLVLHTAQAALAAFVYALAFAATMGPLSMATLAARSRAGGYMLLALFLILPDVLLPWSGEILPEGWGELGSIPGALHALRDALAPPHVDLGLALRSVAVLALVIALALLALRAELLATDRVAAPGEART